MSEGKPIGEMSFEEAIRELEQVVTALDRGDVALEASITLYERGAALKARCEAKLKEARGKGDADHPRTPTASRPAAPPVEGL